MAKRLIVLVVFGFSMLPPAWCQYLSGKSAMVKFVADAHPDHWLFGKITVSNRNSLELSALLRSLAQNLEQCLLVNDKYISKLHQNFYGKLMPSYFISPGFTQIVTAPNQKMPEIAEMTEVVFHGPTTLNHPPDKEKSYFL